MLYQPIPSHRVFFQCTISFIQHSYLTSSLMARVRTQKRSLPHFRIPPQGAPQS